MRMKEGEPVIIFCTVLVGIPDLVTYVINKKIIQVFFLFSDPLPSTTCLRLGMLNIETQNEQFISF